MLRVMDAAQTAAVLDFHALRDALEVAAVEMAQGRICSPDRQALPLGEGGTLLSMPATAADIGIHKLVTVMPRNSAQALATIHGAVSVWNARSGQPLCVLDGPVVTGRRTAAISLLGIHRLLGRAPQRVLLIGTGVQALYHVQALQAFYPQCVVVVQGSSAAKAQQFCAQHAGVHAHLQPAGPDTRVDAAADWDVVLMATTARAPIYNEAALPERLVVGVGAFRPEMAEIGAHTLAGSTVYVDDPSGAPHEAGDLIQAGVDWAQVQSLAQAIVQPVPATRAKVFKSVGSAAWDLAAARVAVAALGMKM